MSLQVAQLRETLPPQFANLRAQAEAEGYAFLGRLALRWRDGTYDDDALVSVRAAYVDEDLAGIGAQTYDEYDPHPTHRRIRHFYVAPAYRRHGVGRALADALTADAFALAPRLHLRATHALSKTFWDAMGFERVDRPDRTHAKVRP